MAQKIAAFILSAIVGVFVYELVNETVRIHKEESGE